MMCQKCVEACEEIFPGREDEWPDLLMSFTAFPFSSPEKTRKQLLYLAKVGQDQVMKEFDEQYVRAMKKIREKE